MQCGFAEIRMQNVVKSLRMRLDGNPHGMVMRDLQ
jgi:hypothetical protein